ncbi:MAG: hypothetical protein R2818_07425 [Flavobacteriales bacterium]
MRITYHTNNTTLIPMSLSLRSRSAGIASSTNTKNNGRTNN